MAGGSQSVVIGIDLGTTTCSVGVWRHGQVEMVRNDNGNLSTPSCVAFTDAGRLVGDFAKSQAPRNAPNTVFNIMRIIGRRYDEVRKKTQVVCGPKNNPMIRVVEKGETKELHPEEILAELVVKLKDDVVTYTNARIEHAVVTVPTGFNLLQRQAVRDACAIAGLAKYRISDAPTTAAVAHTSIKGAPRCEVHDMVVDMGGGHLSVSLLTIEDAIFEVKAVAGDACLGGEDFDDVLFDHFAAEFARQYRKDMTTCDRAVRRLRTACEKAKRDLSISNTATLELEVLFGNIDFRSSITRARFEDLCSGLFRRVTQPIDKVLRDAKIDKSQVRDVVLAGGSMRMPKMQQLLSSFFGERYADKKLCHSILNNNEAAAHGATVMAALNDETSPDDLHLLVLHVVPYSVGIETGGGVMTTLISRNTTIPSKKSEKFKISQPQSPPYHPTPFSYRDECTCDDSDDSNDECTCNDSDDLDDNCCCTHYCEEHCKEYCGSECDHGGHNDIDYSSYPRYGPKEPFIDARDNAIKIFTGERSMVRDNTPLHTIAIHGFYDPTARSDVTFDIDGNGLLTAIVTYTPHIGTNETIVVKLDKGYLSQHDVKRLTTNFEAAADDRTRRRVAHEELQTYILYLIGGKYPYWLAADAVEVLEWLDTISLGRHIKASVREIQAKYRIFFGPAIEDVDYY